MLFSKPDWSTFEKGIEKEWLLTNGIGGFASSTIIGANSRRYHGLLVASLKPPVDRHLILSKLDEVLVIDNVNYDIHTDHTSDFTGHGHYFLQSVEVGKTVKYNYNVQDVFIEKKISMVHGKNTTVVVYKINNGSKSAKFRVFPLVNFRNFHGNTSKPGLNFNTEYYENGLVLRPETLDVNIELRASEGIFHHLEDMWFYNMDYLKERERGLNPFDDHFMPGYFRVELEPYENKTITIIASTDGIDTIDGEGLIKAEEERKSRVIKSAGYGDEFAKTLVAASDQFIVYRQSTRAETIIAGYPWFTDWGRDTMIALPGLTLSTKRYDDAKKILLSFVKYTKDGLIPNMFPDEGQEPIYNTVDASLWFFEAVYEFLRHTKEYSFVKEEIYPALKEIILSYKNGTMFNIHMDVDGLISAGGPDVQLTWMDAKVGDWVVTPRHGKAVEINALWYNALKIMGILSRKYNDDSKLYDTLAVKVKKSFEQFWNDGAQCLYDVLQKDFNDDMIRPNQIIAVSLSYPVIEGEKARLVVDKVFKELYATYGLRSLSPFDKEYKGIYIGDQVSRDAAYHQGTVWSWLIGPFIRAYRRVNNYSEESREICLKMLEPFKAHLADAGVNLISEIFDGDEPMYPRGCIAQAWGVAEVLRSYVDLKYKSK